MALNQTAGLLPVTVALIGNALVATCKFAGAFLSGSSVLFSEAIHSVADTLNQLFLLIGVRRSLKKPDDDFEYGYGNERFFWALISACGIFFIGACITGYKGVMAILEPGHLEFHWIVIPVLLISFAVEMYTLRVAARQLRESFPGSSWRERLSLADPSTLAVYLEDAVAVLGVVIAAISLVVAFYTGNHLWDAVGSIIIAVLLGVVAIFLIVKNRAHLIGHAMPEEMQDDIVEMLEADPSIDKVIDFKSSVIAWGIYRIKFEIDFNGTSLLRELYRDVTMKEQYEEVSEDLEEFKRFVANYADRIPRLMGKKIDEIEKRLKSAYPGLRHIDIEIN